MSIIKIPTDRIASAVDYPLGNGGRDKMQRDGLVLHSDYHKELIADANRYARIAGVSVDYLWRLMSDHCSDYENDYVMDLNTQHLNSKFGILYYRGDRGKRKGGDVLERMMVIAATCLRNYINARIIEFHELEESLKEGTGPDATVVLIPDFYTANQDNVKYKWTLPKFYSYLLSRRRLTLQTFLYVSNLKRLKSQYNEEFADFLHTYYVPFDLHKIDGGN